MTQVSDVAPGPLVFTSNFSGVPFLLAEYITTCNSISGVGGLAYVNMCLCNNSGVLSPKDYIYVGKKGGKGRGLSL